jgi:hypothetical protein
MEEYAKQYFDARNEFHGYSKALFKTQQDYLKKLQDLKEYKLQVKEQKNEYINNMTQLALRAANITYMKEKYDQEEQYWERQIHHQEGVVQEKREILDKTLKEYREIRNNIASYQTRVTEQIDKGRSNALNTISFVNYTKSLIEKEMKNTSSINYSLSSTTNGQTYLMNKKMLLKLQRSMYGRLSKIRQHTKEFYLHKISEFRQQERIYFGRTRELIEQTLDHATHAANNPTALLSAPNPGAAALLAHQQQFLNEDDDEYSPAARQQDHFLENWIVNKICAKDMDGEERNEDGKMGEEGMNGGFDEFDDEDFPNNSLSMMSSTDEPTGSSRGHRRSIHSAGNSQHGGNGTAGSAGSGRIKRHSLVQQGEMLQFLDRIKSRTPSSTTGTNTGSMGTQGGGHKVHITPMGSIATASQGPQRVLLAAPNMDMQPRIFTTSMQGNNFSVHINGSTYATNNAGHGTSSRPGTHSTTATNATGHPSTATGHHNHHPPTNNNSKAEEEQNIIYDPNEFLPACSADILRPYCIMEMQKGIHDREERMSKLALLTAKAKGKVKQLTCIKEGLDQEITKQGCLLLMVLDLLETQTLKSPLLNTGPGTNPSVLTNRSKCNLQFF